jgi:hypothetical protein
MLLDVARRVWPVALSVNLDLILRFYEGAFATRT